MATFNYIQPPVNTGAGLKIDTAELTNGSNTVERQVVVIGDPATAASVASVTVIGAGIAASTGLVGVASVPFDGGKTSYAASYKATSVGTSATTNLFTITGSATKTVRVTRLAVSGTIATTAEEWDLLIVKQSAADTGGSSTPATVVPYDSGNAAGTATVNGYTVAPTAGAAVGALYANKLTLPISPAAATAITVTFGDRPAQAVVLRGIAQVLAVTANGVTPGHASSMDFYVEWTEE